MTSVVFLPTQTEVLTGCFPTWGHSCVPFCIADLLDSAIAYCAGLIWVKIQKAVVNLYFAVSVPYQLRLTLPFPQP